MRSKRSRTAVNRYRRPIPSSAKKQAFLGPLNGFMDTSSLGALAEVSPSVKINNGESKTAL